MKDSNKLTEEEISELLDLWTKLTPEQRAAILSFIRCFL